MVAGGHTILLLRHGAAESPAPGRRDEDRGLTGDGREQVRAVAAAMHALGLRVDVILASPLPRAMETATIVAERYRGVRIVETAALAPRAGADGVIAALASHDACGAVLLVGHQPDLGELVSTLLVGTPGLVTVALHTAGLAAVRVASLPPQAAGSLEFLVTAEHARKIAGTS